MDTQIRNWVFHLLSFYVAAGSLLAQQIQSLPSPQVTTFANGYEIVDTEGKVLKTIAGPQEATIQAFVDIDGVRYFMTDWSYRRALQGIKPNWIRPLPLPRPMVVPPIPDQPAAVETFPVSAARPEVQLPVGHLRAVTGAHLLPNHRLLTCSKDATAIIWDLQSGLPVRRLFLPEQCFALEAIDGPTSRVKLHCGTGRRGYQQIILDLENGRMEIREIDQDSQPEPRVSADILEKTGASGDITLAISSPSGPLAVLGFRDGSVEVWSLQPVARIHQLKQEVFPITSVAEAGGVIATWRFGSLIDGATRHDLTFWRPDRLEVVAAEKQGSGNRVSGGFLAGGSHFFSCEDNGFESSWFMVVRETSTGRIVDRQPTENRKSGTLWIHPDRTTAVLSHYGNTGPGVSIWQFEKGKLKQVRSHPSIESNVAIYDRTRDRLISGVFTIEEEPGLSLGVYSARTGRKMPALSPLPAAVFGTTISLSTDRAGRRFILGNYHRSIGFCTIGNLEDGQHRSFEIEGIHTTQFRPGFNQVLLGGNRGNHLGLAPRCGVVRPDLTLAESAEQPVPRTVRRRLRMDQQEGYRDRFQ